MLGVLLAVTAIACGEPHGVPTRVIVPRGSSLAVAADSLERAGIISSPKLFRVYAMLTGRDRRVKPGTYLLQRGSSWGAVLSALAGGKGLVHPVTIPEGFAINQISQMLMRALDVPPESIKAAVRDTALLHRLDVPTPTLEGYLFPDTYAFPEGTNARQAVNEMVRGFERRWDTTWTDRLQQLAMTRHDIVTLASIIEREARLPEERAVISAVYHNRLKKGMLLQADPTVQYALGRHVARVLYRDLEVESPYNTYKHAGLPPGPIGSPGIASIRAALFPANVPYLYFVADSDGHHEFRTTFAEHTEARKEVRRPEITSPASRTNPVPSQAAPRTTPVPARPAPVRPTPSRPTTRKRPSGR